MNQLPDHIADTFERQAQYCEGPGLSPFSAAACRAALQLAATDTAFGRTIAGWPADPRADALALRAIAGFHALKRQGDNPELDAVYPPHRLDPNALEKAFSTALAAHDNFLADWLKSPPQTNEPNRSGIVLGALLTIAHETKLPLRLFEIGASGGLNLNAVHYRYDLGTGQHWGQEEGAVSIASEWRGNVPDPTIVLDVQSVKGCDLNPLDVDKASERLLAYIWPDQPDRLGRMEAAIAFARVQRPHVEKADAGQWVEDEIASRPGSATLLYHTVVWQYLPQATKARIQDHMERAGARASAEAPLFWFRCEADETGEPGAALTLTKWPGGETRQLGRADFHGRWVQWQ